ncbi:MAG: ketoacyl-ACP synthase III [Nitrospirae bacterium]|nr:ketoacyl-ACP synthase III [Nitrospirota bacterium]
MVNTNIYIAGTGSYLPSTIITNRNISDSTGVSSEDIEKMTGIQERRMAGRDEATSDLATKAAVSALESAGIKAGDLDFIILSTTSPDMPFPATACIVQENIGANKAAAFDINASCSGFLYALNIAEVFLKNGEGSCALVIAAEIKSRFVNPTDRETAILFGDGAGAVVLKSEQVMSDALSKGDENSEQKQEVRSKKQEIRNTTEIPPPLTGGRQGEGELRRFSSEYDISKKGILKTRLFAQGKNWDWIHLPAGGSRIPITEATVFQGLHFMKMDGGKVYRAAIRTLEKVITDITKECNLNINDIDHYIFHQANLRIVKQVMKRLGINEEKVPISLEYYGNTSSASIPITLDPAVRSGRIKEGNLILMASFGGGLTWGASILRWEKRREVRG